MSLFLKSVDSSKSSEPVSSTNTTIEEIPMENLKVAEEKGTGALNEIDGEEAKPSTPKDALKTVDEEGAATPTGKENEPPLEAVARPLTRRETKRLSTTRHTFKTPPPVAPARPKRVESKRSNVNPYTRPVSVHHVSSHLPSCSTLPHVWNPIHDRFIAYLATHAPLTPNGKIPAKEEGKDRWAIPNMILLLRQRFPKLANAKLRVGAIEERLTWLDAHGDNDYFRIPYGAYRMEEWGRGI